MKNKKVLILIRTALIVIVIGLLTTLLIYTAKNQKAVGLQADGTYFDMQLTALEKQKENP